jgi:hypothetical protein
MVHTIHAIHLWEKRKGEEGLVELKMWVNTK